MNGRQFFESLLTIVRNTNSCNGLGISRKTGTATREGRIYIISIDKIINTTVLFRISETKRKD